jgi:hypothetical protein
MFKNGNSIMAKLIEHRNEFLELINSKNSLTNKAIVEKKRDVQKAIQQSIDQAYEKKNETRISRRHLEAVLHTCYHLLYPSGNDEWEYETKAKFKKELESAIKRVRI